LNNNLKKIESGAFWNCKSLASISIPAGVTEISIEAFCGCPCEEQILKDYVHLFTIKGKPCAEEVKRDYPHLFADK
jgi:hypothetical protein